MTINSTGALQNANGTSSTLTVTGDVTNGGVIKNHTSGGTLTLTLNGNVTNNGTWTNQTTNLGGDGTRTLTASQAFTAGTIVVTANRAVSGSISVTSLTVNTTKQLTVPTSADKITINATANIDGSLTGSGTVLFKANVSSANTNVDSITFDGNQQIDGSYTASTLIEFITSGTTKSIPDISGTDLTLNGTVTINSGVTISNVSGNNSTSTMTGAVTNNGTIKNHTSGGTLTLTLNGNVTNNGTWTNQTTNLGGDGTRTLTASQAFTAGTIVVTANRAVSGSISVTSLTVNTTKQLTVPTSADKITINATANIDGSLTGSGTVLFKANVSSANTNVDSITFDGNQQIDGSYTASTLIEFITSGTTKSIPDISGTDLTLNGTVTINSGVTISNVSGNNSTSTMTGAVTNNGTITNYTSNGTLTTTIRGDVTNNGTWTNQTTTLAGGGSIGGSGTYASPNECLVDSTTRTISGYVTIERLHIAAGAKLTVDTLNTLKMAVWNKTESTGSIEGRGTILFYGNQSARGIYKVSVIQFEAGAIEIPNDFTGSDMTLQGTVTVVAGATIQNAAANGSDITVTGDLTNNGTIRSYPSNGTLNVTLNNNVTNDGTWANYVTTFQGTGSAGGANPYASTNECVVTTLTRTISGNVTIDRLRVATGGKLTVDTPNSLKTTVWTTTQGTGRVEGTGTIIFWSNQPVQGYYKVSQIQFDGGTKEIPNVLTGADATFEGTVTVTATATIQNAAANGSDITVTGDITNDGLIRDYPSNGTLAVTITGNITNNGTWTNVTTNLGGDGTKTLSASQAFTAGTIVVTADRSISGDVTVYSLTVNASKQLTVPAETKITTNGTVVINGSLAGSGTVQYNGNVSSANTNVTTVTFGGNQQVSGKYVASSLIEFVGSGTVKEIPNPGADPDLALGGTVTINSGVTLRNVAAHGSTASITGNLTNNGTITNYPSNGTLVTTVRGDVTNNGTWTNQTTTLAGGGSIGGSGTYASPNECLVDSTIRTISGYVTIERLHIAAGAKLTVDTLNTLKMAVWNKTESTGSIEGRGTILFYGNQSARGIYKVSVIQFEAGAIEIPNDFTGSDMTLQGTVTVVAGATIQNAAANGSDITVTGDLTNNGTIRSYPSNGTLNVTLNNNVTNDGTWANYVTTFQGTGSAGGANPYASTNECVVTTLTRTISGNVTIDRLRVATGGKLTVDTPNSLKTTVWTTTQGTGRVEGTGTIIFWSNQPVQGYYKVSQIQFDGGTKEIPNVLTGADATFEGTVTVTATATIQNAAANGSDITVTGDLTNNGTIRSYPSNGTLAVTITGNITNNGTWTIQTASLGGDGTTSIGGSGGYGGTTVINASRSVSGTCTITGTLQLNSGTFSVGNATLTLNNPLTGTTTNLTSTSNSTYIVAGTASGITVPYNAFNLKNLIVDNTNGVTLDPGLAGIQIFGTLELKQGTVLGTPTVSYGASGVLKYSGSAAQTTSDKVFPTSNGPVTLSINNPAGVNLHANREIITKLELLNGNVNTGTYTLKLGPAATVTRTSGHVVGNLQKTIPAGTSPSALFEIGYGTSYLPVTVAFNNVGAAGDLTATVSGSADHADIANSRIDTAKSVNRWWRITNSGVVFASASAALSFTAGDIDTVASWNRFVVSKKDGASWTEPVVGTRTATTIQAIGLTTFSDFIVGELEAAWPTITSVSPSTGPVGTTVIINGSNFDPTPANNSVYFGGVGASVSAASTTSLTVAVPSGATFDPITVTTNGLTATTDKPFGVTFDSQNVIDDESFGINLDFTTGTSPEAIVAMDVDRDGKPDLSVVNEGGANVSVFRNTGTPGSISSSTLLPKVDFTAGTAPHWAAYGDIDGDGKLDLIVTNFSSGSVSIYRNTSTSGTINASTFAARVDFPAGTGADGVAVGDIDGDGKPDLAVTNASANTVSVFRNTSVIGSVSMQPKVDFATGATPLDAHLSDINGDGRKDIVLVNKNSNTFSVFRSTSSPGFIDATSFAGRLDFMAGTTTMRFAVADLDNDGKPDVVVPNYGSGNVSIFRNVSTADSASFSLPLDITVNTNPSHAAVNDIDGDGKPDIVIAHYGSNAVSVFKNKTTSGSFTSSSFGPKVDFYVMTGSYAVNMTDINGDSKPDMVVSNYGASSISILENRTMSPPPLTMGKALQFDGVKSHLDCGTATNIAPATTITLEAWVKPTDVQSNWAKIIERDYSGATYPYISWALEAYGTTKKFGFEVNLGGTLLQLSGTKEMALNQWHHVAAVYDGSTASIYVNGVLEATASQTGTISYNLAKKVRIGSNRPEMIPRESWKGNIDEVRIWDVARTQTQIQGAMKSRLVGNEAGLVGYWRLDEGGGVTTADNSGKGNPGTFTDGPVWLVSDAPSAGSGDFRSKQSGDWSLATNWEKFDGSVWTAAASAPAQADGAINVLANHTMSVLSDMTLDNLIVRHNGSLSIAATKTLTLDGGPGDTFVEEGTLDGPGLLATQGMLTIHTSGNFYPTLWVTAGTTSANGPLQGGIITEPGATLTSTTSIEFAGSSKMFTNNGTVTSKTVFSGASPTLTGSGTFSSEVVADPSSGSLTLSSDHTIARIVIAAAKTFNLPSSTLTLTGTPEPLKLEPAASFTTETGTVSYTGSSPQTVAGGLNYYNLTIDKLGGTATAGSNFGVMGTFSLVNGTFDLSRYTANAYTGPGLTEAPSPAKLTIAAGPPAGFFSVENNSTLVIGHTSGFPQGYAAVNLGPATTVDFDTTVDQTIHHYPAGLTFGNLKFSGSGTKIDSVGGFTVLGDFTLDAGVTFEPGNFSYHFEKLFENKGTYGTTAGETVLDGSTAQDLKATAPTAFKNLTINNPAGVTLTGDAMVVDTLSLSIGVLATGANTVTMGEAGNVVTTTGHVYGRLKKSVLVGTESMRFEVGTATESLPIDLTFTGISASGMLTASASSGAHPQLGSSLINASKNVNAFWSLVNDGVTATFDAVFNFTPAILDAGANTANFAVGKHDGTTWSYPTVGTTTATSTEITSLTSFSDFAVGEIMSVARTWDGGGGDGKWTTTTNWNPDGVPGAFDDVSLDNTSVTGSYVVTLDALSSQTVRSLVVGYTGNTNAITLRLEGTTTDLLRVGNNLTAGIDLQVLDGGILENNGSPGAGNRVISAVGSAIDEDLLLSGTSKYIHNQSSGDSPFSAFATTFATGSTVVLTTSSATSYELPYYHLILSSGSHNPGSTSMSISGDLTIQGTATFTGTTSGTPVHTVTGTFSLAGGTFVGTDGTGNPTFSFLDSFNKTAGTYTAATSTGIPTFNFTGSGPAYLNMAGTVTNSRHILVVDASRTIQLQSDLPVSAGGSLTVNGTLLCGSMNVTGSGDFTLSSYATLGIGSPAGITTTGTTGNIQVTGTRTLDPLANYKFTGSLAQSTGNGFPTSVLNLEVNNAAGITLSKKLMVTDTLTLTAGNVTTGADTLMMGTSASITETAPYSVIGKLTTTRVCTTGINQTFGGPGLEIFDPSVWLGTTTVTRVTGSASTLPYGSSIKRYFDVSPATNTGLGSTVVFRYLDGELNGLTESKLVLYQSTDGGSTWTNRGGTVNTSANSVSLSGVTSFSRWTAGESISAPTLVSVSPKTAAVGTTLNIILKGTNFITGVTTVSFGGTGITINSTTVDSTTQITVNVTIGASAQLAHVMSL
jgi:hypothetical protein